MDKITVTMVKSILADVVDAKDKETASLIYQKFGGEEIVEERYRRRCCLSNTPEVQQAIKEFFGGLHNEAN